MSWYATASNRKMSISVKAQPQVCNRNFEL